MKKILVVVFFLLAFWTPTKVYATSSSASPFNVLVRDMTIGILGQYDKNGHIVSEGAVTFFAKSIDTLVYTPPASFKDYSRYLSGKFHIPGTPVAAYAAGPGIGYNALAPILPFWTAMRNLAYFFFAVFFVIAGIMIMLRTKIDPKTAATIQTILPKLILTLVLVTFSYAIAGFLIDIMYVAIGLVLTIANSITGAAAAGAAAQVQAKVANENILSFFLGPGTTITFNAAGAVTQVVSNFLRGTFAEAGGALLNLFTGSIATLIIAIAIIWALIKTWIILLTAYGQAILGIIFAPMRIAFDAIPGQNQFEGWVREMLANLLVFPAVVMMIFLALALSSSTYDLGNGFVPPLIGGNSQPAVQALIGLMIILTTPKTLEIIQQIIKTPQNKWGTAWNEAINFGRGAAATGAGAIGVATRDRLFGRAGTDYEKKEKAYKTAGVGAPPPAMSWRERIAHNLRAKEPI